MKTDMHPVEVLFEAMKEVEPYPDGIGRFCDRLRGVGFFPGGSGLWNTTAACALPRMPIDEIMVLGHDFHSEAAFARSLAAGSEVLSSPTWRTLRSLLSEAEIDPARCFFTNAYMGLRRGAATTGRFPGARDRGFVDRCRSFLLRQISIQRPRIILTLGKWVPAFVAPLSKQLSCWERGTTLLAVDASSPVIHDVSFRGLDITPCSLVALTHPCLRGPNLRRRTFRDLTGHQAELAMIREAISKVFA